MKSSALLVSFSLALLAGPVCAQQPLAGDALKTLVSGKSVDVGNDGTATYKADGKYDYFSKSNGRTFRGQWSVQADRLCVNFDNGNQRWISLCRMAIR